MAEHDLVKRIEDIEQALVGVYSILGEDGNHREKLIRFLSEEDTDETLRSFVSRFKLRQGEKEIANTSLFDVLGKALRSSIPLPSKRGLYDG